MLPDQPLHVRVGHELRFDLGLTRVALAFAALLQRLALRRTTGLETDLDRPPRRTDRASVNALTAAGMRNSSSTESRNTPSA